MDIEEFFLKFPCYIKQKSLNSIDQRRGRKKRRDLSAFLESGPLIDQSMVVFVHPMPIPFKRRLSVPCLPRCLYPCPPLFLALYFKNQVLIKSSYPAEEGHTP